MIRPKPFLDNFKLRHKAIGTERRLNMTKVILEKAPNFPLSIEYKDIDQAFQKWVEDDVNITYDGIKVPTFRLFSNQRINEYAQTWKHLDSTGNILMNFKTITRENNPKHGENQGSSYNIPGERTYPMFLVPVLQENGQQAYDLYSMKQPFCVDLIYTVTLVTNKFELLNVINQIMLDKFKAIDCYIAPNNHYMPMTLENITDESEYSLDDMKYYSQSFQIKIKAYIIKESDYQVTKIPSRAIVRMLGINDKKKPKISIEEEDDTRYYNKSLKLNIVYPICEHKAQFDADFDMVIQSQETTNVFDYVVCINGEPQNLTKEIRIYRGDEFLCTVSKEDDTKDAIVSFIGYDPTEILDSTYDPESSLDEPIKEEIIDIKL